MAVPRTIDEVREGARVVYSPADIPRLIAEDIGWWRTTVTPTTIRQEHVDAFTGSIGDTNPIHRSDFCHPIAPGMMTVSSLPRFLAECVPIFMYDFGVIFEHINADFKDFIFVGESVHTGYRVHEPQVSGSAALVKCEFSVQVVGVKTVAVTGEVAVRFIERKLFDQFVARASRRLRAPTQ